ncbi:hypothetical protein HK107_06130 [Parvularcula sp. ZS-1/3]|uniref:Uncharacterized protein n=1 Tax=Parvularcula mediterranea TaxID=2732508 RepID=A0A7Y3RKS9_9PROT|nr:hypothetical protein [Parvularcula mediterranea]NNU15899.1 hypothetical protein [Parvularcula mediterranea]
MMDLFGQMIGVFDSAAGVAVLGMAMLAFLGLFIFVFWDSLNSPRRDEVRTNSLQTSPPPLLDPEIVGRSSQSGWRAGGTPIIRNSVLVGIGALFVVAGFIAAGTLADENATRTTVKAGLARPHQAVLLQPQPQVRTVRTSLAAPAERASSHVSLCEPSGSFADRAIETCANGASVRFDLLRFSHGDRYVVRPAWNNAAATFVKSDSHAVPFTFTDAVSFAAPETVEAPRYDGFLVIGVGDGEKAARREEALRDFAIAKLSGGDRSECTSSERVFSVSADFDAARVAELNALRLRIASLERQARRDQKARSELATAREELARLQLFVVDNPAPIVIGITADPNSSDAVADMLAASREFVRIHRRDLQIDNPGPVGTMRACARGEGTL